MADNSFNLDFSKNLEKSIHKELEKEFEEQYELQNYSTSTSSLGEINDSFSTEDLKSCEKDKMEEPIFPKKSLEKDLVSSLIKMGKNTHSSYLNKLINKNILFSSPKKINNIFIFDWDDTLFCTSVLNPNGFFDDEREISPSQMRRIKELELFVKNLLTKAIEKGDTYIITNSEAIWVEYSCELFFPNVYKFLNKIKIISGRDLYEEKFPHDYKTWKIKAFNEIIKNYSLNLPTNIMSFGDSSYEEDASYDLVKKFPNGFIKFIKFREIPLIQDLINQLTIVLEKFNFYCSACKNWTIYIDQNY
jgi:hypothetical protein